MINHLRKVEEELSFFVKTAKAFMLQKHKKASSLLTTAPGLPLLSLSVGLKMSL